MVVVGLRLGATLAVGASRSQQWQPEGLVLWDPAESGRKWLRHQVLLHRLFVEGRAESQTPDGVEVTGFLYETTTATAIQSLRLGEVDDRLAGKVLVLGGDVRRVDVVTSDGPVSTAGASHRADFLDISTILSRLPTKTMSLIVNWCGQNFPAAEYSVAGAYDTSALIPAGDGDVIRERAVHFGPGAMFGLVSEPMGEARGPGAVFLNVGIEPHVGPARMWVDLARRWAAQGIRSVRVDLSGLGDSDPARGENPAVAFSPQAMADMRQIAEEISPQGPSSLVWIGVCSGGYHALEVAAGLGAAGAFVVNPALTVVAPEEHDLGVKTWRRMCSFIPRWARSNAAESESLIKSKRHISGLLYRILYRLGLTPAPVRGLIQLSRNSLNTLIVTGPRDAKPLLWFRFGKMIGMYGSTRLKIISDLHHSLQSPRQRVEIGQLATRWLLEEVVPEIAVGDRVPTGAGPDLEAPRR